MLTLSVGFTIDHITKGLDDLSRKQIPFAASIALNRTAEFSKNSLKAYMNFGFDRPKPYTLNSIFIKRATKTNLNATIFHSDAVSKYLRPMIEGGYRENKRFEALLDFGGAMYVPSKNIKLDQHGNIPRSLLRAIIAADKGEKSRGIFVVREKSGSRLKPGVYRRTNKKLEQLLFRVPSAKYQPTYDMIGIVERTANSEFVKQFYAALDHAVRTAR